LGNRSISSPFSVYFKETLDSIFFILSQEFGAMVTAIRAGLLSRSEAISSFGYDAEDIDREIAADNARADSLGLVFESDPRHDKPGVTLTPSSNAASTANPATSAENL
jgi:capsid protein